MSRSSRWSSYPALTRYFRQQRTAIVPVENAQPLKLRVTEVRVLDALRVVPWAVSVDEQSLHSIDFSLNLRTTAAVARSQSPNMNTDLRRPGRTDLSGMRPDELVAYYRNLEAKLLCHWDAPGSDRASDSTM